MRPLTPIETGRTGISSSRETTGCVTLMNDRICLFLIELGVYCPRLVGVHLFSLSVTYPYLLLSNLKLILGCTSGSSRGYPRAVEFFGENLSYPLGREDLETACHLRHYPLVLWGSWAYKCHSSLRRDYSQIWVRRLLFIIIHYSFFILFE